MPKYIKAEGLLSSGRDFLSGVLFVRKGRSSGKTLEMVIELLRRIVDAAPAEDVESVVRCKDCKKRMRNERDNLWWCMHTGYRCNNDDWFCAG